MICLIVHCGGTQYLLKEQMSLIRLVRVGKAAETMDGDVSTACSKPFHILGIRFQVIMLLDLNLELAVYSGSKPLRKLDARLYEKPKLVGTHYQRVSRNLLQGASMSTNHRSCAPIENSSPMFGNICCLQGLDLGPVTAHEDQPCQEGAENL
jgi:hypothetical protein